MGNLKDWSKVFEDLEYFLYGAKMVIEKCEKNYATEKWDELKESILDSFEKNAVKDDYVEKFIKNEEKMRHGEEVAERYIVEDKKLLKQIESEKALGFEAYEKERKITSATKATLENVKKSAPERLEWDTVKRGEIGSISFKRREQIIESQFKKDNAEGERIKLEVNNVNNLNNDVDFDTVTEVITQRLMDAIQKSAEGLYI